MERATGGHARTRRVRVGWAGVLMALWGLLAGCGQPSAELKLDSVAPQQIPYGVSTRVRVQGSFVPRLSVDLSTQTATSLDDTFQVEVGTPEVSVTASEVHFLGPDELEIVIPDGLTAGMQRMVVIDPRGQRAVLENAINVVTSPPTQIGFDRDFPLPTTCLAGQWTVPPIHVTFLDANGQKAATTEDQTAVRVWTDSPTGELALDLAFSTGDPWLWFLAFRGNDGFNFVYRDTTPGKHTLYVSMQGQPPISTQVTVQPLILPSQLRLIPNVSTSAQVGLPLQLSVELEDASGKAIAPSQPVDVLLTATADGTGLALTPDGPFQPTLTVRLSDAGPTSFYFRSTEALSSAELQATASLPDGGPMLAPDTLSIPVASATAVILDAPGTP